MDHEELTQPTQPTQRLGPRHLVRAAAVIALLVTPSAFACAPAQGWTPSRERTCERETPAMICAEVIPDRPLRFDLGGTSIVPGECARAPAKGGLVRIAVDDGRSGAVDQRWIRAPRGRVTWVSVRDRKLRLRVAQRQRCDREPMTRSTSDF